MTLRLTTARLELIFATAEMVRAELDGVAGLGSLLGIDTSPHWPTEYWDRSGMEWTIRALESGQNAEGWGMWYWLLRNSHSNRLKLIGHGGFKSKPDDKGVVEIGYAITQEHRRCGLATEACGAMIDWAFSHSHVQCVTAETFPDLLPSIGVMKKLGMSMMEGASEPGAIRYGLHRHSAVTEPAPPSQSHRPAL